MSEITSDSLNRGIIRQGNAEIERLTRELREEREAFLSRQLHDKKLITELALGIDAVQLDTCTDEDWDRLNEVAQRAREATR